MEDDEEPEIPLKPPTSMKLFDDFNAVIDHASVQLTRLNINVDEVLHRQIMNTLGYVFDLLINQSTQFEGSDPITSCSKLKSVLVQHL